MARSSSAQKAFNWILALLTLWSTISLIVIVVWATWPPFASITHCRAAQQALMEKMEGAKVMRDKEQEVVESALQLSLENQTRLKEELDSVLEIHSQISASLTESLQLQMVLKENVTALEDQRLVHYSEHERLSSELAQQEALIEFLWVNVSSESHQLDACAALRNASISQQAAAESQRKACQSKTTHLSKQVDNCKVSG